MVSLPSSDPSLRSWVEVDPASDFPLQNLPYGVFRRDEASPPAVGVAIGDHVLDLAQLHEAGLFGDTSIADDNVFARPFLNNFMACGRAAWTEVRQRVSHLLRHDNPALRDATELRYNALIPLADVLLEMPVSVRDTTDFYSSLEHATNLGTMFRGADNALLPNWRHLPVGYHGRASSIVLSGTPVRRPHGQSLPDGADAPVFGPSRALDFELEVAFFVGLGNRLGTPIPTAAARDHVFGLVLFNDWSARDIQKWEYQPLGPFLGKNFASTISPWVVTLDALEPFRVPGPPQEPAPLAYLACREPWSFDIHLEAWLTPAGASTPLRITATNHRHLYWNIAQQLAHHTSNGCNTATGDCMASGTISGPTPESRGSMVELAWKGTSPILLPDGSERRWLHDGDTLTLRGWGQGDGFRVGFGECAGTILPASA